jgi:hypothetical protein
MPARGFCLTMLLLCRLAASGPAPPAGPVLRVSALDPENHAVAGVQIELRPVNLPVITRLTDERGQVIFSDLRPGLYSVVASKDGYQPAHQAQLAVEQDSAISL